MKLSDFEEYIDGPILERGKKYYEGPYISGINEIEKNHYVVEIFGSEAYSVNVLIGEKEEVRSTLCNCPYDRGKYCKHQVAAFYRIRDAKHGENKPTLKPKESPTATNEPDLKSTLSSLKKDELVQVLMDISDDQPEIEQKLLFEYAPAEDEIKQSKKMIRDFVNKAKHGGFIHWNEVGYAVQGANTTLDKAIKRKNTGNTESAVMLSLAVLSITTDMLQYSDDSNGDVGDCIRQSLKIIEEAVAEGIHHLSEKDQTKLFNTLLKSALQKRYDGWTDTRVSLLGCCVHFAENRKRREKLEKQLESLLEHAGDSWGSDFLKEEVKLLQLNLIEQFDNPETALAFINDNIEYSKFREKAILHHLENEDYKQVIELCEEGEDKDSFFAGRVSTWKKYQLRAYEGLGNTGKVRELTRGFLLAGEFKYYNDLKKLYEPKEWERVLEEILDHFEKQHYPAQAYVDILKEEKLYDKLLHYTKQRPKEIQTLYPYLMDKHFEEVNELYQQFIKNEAEQATERKKYKKVCKLIKSYKKICGETNSRKLINDLEQQYKRKPAFIEELEKVK